MLPLYLSPPFGQLTLNAENGPEINPNHRIVGGLSGMADNAHAGRKVTRDGNRQRGYRGYNHPDAFDADWDHGGYEHRNRDREERGDADWGQDGYDYRNSDRYEDGYHRQDPWEQDYGDVREYNLH